MTDMADKKVSQPAVARDQEGRPAYERPVVIPLGELVQGSGRCASGSSPTGGGGNCKSGSSASRGNCRIGNTAGRRCHSGGTPR